MMVLKRIVVSLLALLAAGLGTVYVFVIVRKGAGGGMTVGVMDSDAVDLLSIELFAILLVSAAAMVLSTALFVPVRSQRIPR